MNDLILKQADAIPKFEIESMAVEYDTIVGDILRLQREVSGSVACAYLKLVGQEEAIAAVTSEFWSRTMTMFGLTEYMAATKRSEWNAMIDDCKCPPYVRETVYDTFLGIYDQRMTLLAECADDVFRSLSKRHVTNTPKGFRERMILEYAFSYGSPCYRVTEKVHDLRRLIFWAAGLPMPSVNESRVTAQLMRTAAADRGAWLSCDAGLWWIRAYKCGTIHIEIGDAAYRLNDLLAEKYPRAIASDSTGAAPRARKAPRSVNLTEQIIPHAIREILACLRNYGGTWHLPSDLDKHTKEKVTDLLELLGGVNTGSIYYVFPYDFDEVRGHVASTGVLPDVLSNQYYPTPQGLAARLIQEAGVRPGDRVLEPSAGTGNLTRAIYEAHPQTEIISVEVNDAFAKVLEAHGIGSVIQSDFLDAGLKILPVDRVVMNPPFSHERARLHVTRAVDFLKPGGVLVSIVPEGFKAGELALTPGASAWLSDPIANAFPGVSVKVRIFKYTKGE